MSATGLGLIDAMLAGPKPRKRGANSITIVVDGVEIDCTYNVSGWTSPATDVDPAESPEIELVTADIGGVSVLVWADRFNFEDEIAQERFRAYREGV